MHGGKIPRGHALPQTTHGRYSKHLPTRLAARYAEAQADGDLLALREDVVLLDARLADVLDRVDTGESGRAWVGLRQAYGDLQRAQASQDTAGMRVALVQIGDLIRDGTADWAAWSEVRSILQDRRRLVESERKRLVEMQQTVTVERAMLLVSSLSEAVRRHVTDRDTLAAIGRELDRLTAGGSA